MLTADAFWKKAKLNIATALACRDREDNAMFQFWATISLELLGKACLSSMHPMFVVNPEDFKSVRIACGNLESNEYKTIIAKTLYDRLKLLVDGFDEKAESFCNRMAQKRNEELHSANLPFDGVDLRSWQRQYWRIVKLLCERQGKSLTEFLGAAEAVEAEGIIQDAATAVEAAVRGRINRARVDFQKGKDNATLESLNQASEDIAHRQCTETDVVERCPSCGSFGVLRGSEVDDEYIDHLPYDIGTARIRLFCESEEFKCVMCTLWLAGLDELAVAELPEEFETEVIREFEWEPDYGND